MLAHETEALVSCKSSESTTHSSVSHCLVAIRANERNHSQPMRNEFTWQDSRVDLDLDQLNGCTACTRHAVWTVPIMRGRGGMPTAGTSAIAHRGADRTSEPFEVPDARQDSKTEARKSKGSGDVTGDVAQRSNVVVVPVNVREESLGVAR